MRRTLVPAPPSAGDIRLTPFTASSDCAGLITFRIAPDVIRPDAPTLATDRIAPASYILQRNPWSNFRIAPDVILRLPGLTYSRLAPLSDHSGHAYHPTPGSRRLPNSSPGLAANLRPSPDFDLQLACYITSGLRRMLRTLASPVTQLSAYADCWAAPAKLATSP